jgi:SpoVK/Ycf46/Vps4 family AAA+-type ATPase
LIAGDTSMSRQATVHFVAGSDVQEWRCLSLMPLVPVPRRCLPSADDARLRLGSCAAPSEPHPWNANCHCGCALVRDGAVVDLELRLHGGTATVPFALRAEPYADSHACCGLAEVRRWGHVAASTRIDVLPECDGVWQEEGRAWPAPRIAARQIVPERFVCTCGREGRQLRAMMRATLVGAREEWLASVAPPSSILLTGPAGSGKRGLVREVAEHAGASVITLDASDLCTGDPGALLLELMSRSAQGLERFVLLLDLPNLRATSSTHATAAAASEAFTTDELVRLVGLVDAMRQLEQLAQTWPGSAGGGGCAPRVAVVCVSDECLSVHPSLRTACAFHLSLLPPTPDERLAILRACLRESCVHLLKDDELGERAEGGGALLAIAQRLHGYVGADLREVAQQLRATVLEKQRALTDAQHTGPSAQPHAGEQRPAVSATLAQLEACIGRVPPSSLRELSGARPFIPQIKWTDVGGLAEAKQQLEELLMWPHAHAQLLDSLGVQLAHGVLLYGPPGTGKTLLAQAVACESRLNFLNVQIPELVKGDVGGSEEAIAAVFAKARELAPSLIFLDELQAMFGARPTDDRGAGGGAHTSLAQLLLEMDACHSCRSYQRVSLIGATNVPDALDPSLLQPGRFEHVLLIGPPDQQARVDILASTLRAIPCSAVLRAHVRQAEAAGVPPLETAIEALAHRTEGFSAADLKSLCHSAVYHAIGEGDTALEPAHLEHVLQSFQPSITAEMVDVLRAWAVKFHST